MIKILIKLLILSFLIFLSCVSNKTDNEDKNSRFTNEVSNIDSSDIIYHAAYSLKYNEEHEQAEWISYTLTANHLLMENVERSNNFKKDPLITTGSATPDDYKYSGYDRGHLAPAADMSWSEITMHESFFMSNMSPQAPSFNRGVWKRLEGEVREWAIIYDSLYVVTGPILKDSLKTIGINDVSVPTHYYKTLLVYTSSNKKAIGFILPNEKSQLDIEKFIVSVDSVESITGINFFSSLPDSIENVLESYTDPF